MQSIHIQEDYLSYAWEKAVLKCWEVGESFPTEYDKPDDPNSRDVTAVIHVKSPQREPRIHRAFPGGLGDLEKYRAEVLYGVHDHWCDPEAGKWQYTYSQRMFDYNVPCNCPKIPSTDLLHGGCVCDKCGNNNEQKIDQINTVVEMLRKSPHTRRAQAVIWKVWEDLGIHDPACLQRLWFRCQKEICPVCHGKGEISFGFCEWCNGIGKVDKLNMNVHMRSNDAFKAAYMNMYAFTELQAWVADRLGVRVGEYIHIADSFHIYGSYFDEFEGFIKTVQNRVPEERVFSTDFAIPMFIDGCNELLKEEDMPPNKKHLVMERRNFLQQQMT